MNEQLIAQILDYREKLNIISLLLSEFPREKAHKIVKTIYNLDLNELEKQLDNQ